MRLDPGVQLPLFLPVQALLLLLSPIISRGACKSNDRILQVFTHTKPATPCLPVSPYYYPP